MADDVTRLLQEAADLIKRDPRAAIEKLDAALAQAGPRASEVCEELARAWARRKRSSAKSLYHAVKAAELQPERKSAWATLGKTCELVAVKTTKPKRAQALFRASADAFKKAAALAKDPEDKRWLQELARDAARQGKPKA